MRQPLFCTQIVSVSYGIWITGENGDMVKKNPGEILWRGKRNYE